MSSFYLLDDHLFTFLVILFRIGGFFLTAPIYSKQSVPNQFKIILTVTIAITVMLNHPVVSFSGSLSIVVIAIKEFLFGLFLGWGLKIFFEMLAAGGQIIGQQGGFALANLYDPMTQSQRNVIAKFLNVLIILIFLALNGHIILLQTLLESYQIFPLDLPVELFFKFNFAIKIFTNSFILAVRISAPIMTSVLLTYVALGIMAKIAPQMNLFAMSFPVTLIISLTILTYSINGVSKLMLVEFDQFLRNFLVTLRY